MTIDHAVSGLSRSSMVEALYRASRIVSEAPYDFDGEALRIKIMVPSEKERVSRAVEKIIAEIERASDAKIGELPEEQKAAVLGDLYATLLERSNAESLSFQSVEDLLKELHATTE